MHIDPPTGFKSQNKGSSDSVQNKHSNHNSHADLAKRHSWWIDPIIEEPPAPELNYFSDLSLAKDFNDFKQRIFLALKQMGFTDFSFIHINTAGDADSLVLTTIPRAISQSYFDPGFYQQVATTVYSSKGNDTPFQTKLGNHLNQTAFDQVIAGTASEAYKIANSEGFYGFYNLIANSFDGDGKVMFQLIQRDGDSPVFRDKIAQFMRPLELLLQAIDMIVIQRFAVTVGLKRPPLEIVYKINPAPLRVLQYLANNDLTLQCIADKLSISVVTANKHMETVRKNLGVRTNYAAIKKALIQGLITFDE
jgi:DNA-binding CsgD family transcriptional regulator